MSSPKCKPVRRKEPDNSSGRRGTRGVALWHTTLPLTKTGCALMSRLRHGARKFAIDLPRGGHRQVSLGSW